MSKLRNIVIQVKEDDDSMTEIPIDNRFIEFYKKETGRKNISARGLSKFINHLVDIHN